MVWGSSLHSFGLAGLCITQPDLSAKTPGCAGDTRNNVNGV
jgi:hypothetical protein